jgi:glutathione synthase/RimK-type ligase-like ATP-grasp enzyme
LSPAIYQALVPKRFDLRVTIVGQRIFAAAIDSQSDPAAVVDWRHTDNPRLPHHSVSLPEHVADKLLRLMDSFRLTFGAIDMIHTPDDDYVFLEVNPSGQWLWLDDMLEFGISNAVAEWLAGTESQ